MEWWIQGRREGGKVGGYNLQVQGRITKREKTKRVYGQISEGVLSSEDIRNGSPFIWVFKTWGVGALVSTS